MRFCPYHAFEPCDCDFTVRPLTRIQDVGPLSYEMLRRLAVKVGVMARPIINEWHDDWPPLKMNGEQRFEALHLGGNDAS